MKKNILQNNIVLMLMLFLSYLGYGQCGTYNSLNNWVVPINADNSSAINPFCAGSGALTFENTHTPGAGTGGPGMGAISCLATTPNASWYYMQIDNPGNLEFTLSQTSNAGGPLDVDFLVWGPFSSLSQAHTNVQQDPHLNCVDCSYLSDATEQVNIPNAQTGQIYVFLITNYGNQPGSISLQQTGGTGSTSCDIVCAVDLGMDINMCGAVGLSSVTLEATFGDAAGTGVGLGAITFIWTGQDVMGNNIPLIYNSTDASITVTQSGTYTVVASAEHCDQDYSDTVNVLIGEVPQINYNVPDIQGPPSACNPCFDLTATIPTILTAGNPSDYIVSFHTNQIDADTGSNPIPNPQNYCITEDELIYVYIASVGNPGCFDNTTFNLTVDCSVSQPPDVVECDEDNNGFNTINLATIAANYLPSIGFNYTFYNSQADADAGTNPIGTTIIVNANGTTQVVYIRAEDQTTAGAYTTTFVNLVVHAIPNLNTAVTDYLLCEQNGDGQEVFD
ncbi:MAG: hypothetical protein Q4B43_08575, partial [Bacteroidota bacterium]|nr:hypothetical protein [Bacteroidota bacterium]